MLKRYFLVAVLIVISILVCGCAEENDPYSSLSVYGVAECGNLSSPNDGTGVEHIVTVYLVNNGDKPIAYDQVMWIFDCGIEGKGGLTFDSYQDFQILKPGDMTSYTFHSGEATDQVVDASRSGWIAFRFGLIKDDDLIYSASAPLVRIKEKDGKKPIAVPGDEYEIFFDNGPAVTDMINLNDI